MKPLCTLFISLLFSCTLMNGQTVSTISDGIFVDGIGIDSNSIIYCSDYFGDQVFSYNPQNGQVDEFTNGLITPNGIGVTPDDRIYVCEATQNRITVFDTAGNQIDQITGLTNPTGIKYDTENERLLVVSYGGNSLISLDPTTNQTQMIVNGSPFSGPSGIAFINDQIYLSNFNDRKVFRLTADNQLEEITQLPAGGTGNPPRNFLGFLTALDGFLYATQQGEHRIYKIDPNTGETSVFSGSSLGNADGSLEDATYNRPNGILADEVNDIIYVSEIATGNLRIISDASLGFQELKNKANLLLFPIPVDNLLQLKSSLIKIENVIIYDMLGNKVLEKKYSNRDITFLNVDSLSAGNYIIRIFSEGKTLSYKFIKN